jgi:HK97 family phage major capsid protein
VKEQIASFEAKRQASQAAADDLLRKAGEETRTFDQEEQASYDELTSEVKNIDAHLERLRSREDVLEKTAVVVKEDAGRDNQPAGSKVRYGDGRVQLPQLEKGIPFTRFCTALASSKGNLDVAVKVARRWKDSTPQVLTILEICANAGTTKGWGLHPEDEGTVASHLRTAIAPGTTQDSTWASPLVQYDNMASEFVELLRPKTIIGRLPGLRRVPFNIRFPSQTAGSTMYWSGEGTPKKVSKLSLATNTLGFAKAAGIVVITQELARLSSPAAEALVRNDMIAAMVAFLDAQFIDPGVAAVANVNPASITNGLTSQNQATGATLATFEVDAAAAMTVLLNGEVPFDNAVWITTPYTAMKIGMLRDAGGALAFPNVTVAGGTLYGIPVITSNSVPHSTSAGSIMVLMAQGDVFLADDGGIEVDASDQASLELSDSPTASGTTGAQLVSLWQENLLGIRCERYINWQRRRTAAVTYIDNLHL